MFNAATVIEIRNDRVKELDSRSVLASEELEPNASHQLSARSRSRAGLDTCETGLVRNRGRRPGRALCS